jgi:integrase/recombinase XerD
MVFAKDESSERLASTSSQTRVQMWFRAPKIWGDFLEQKAAKECCNKSALLRRAFRLAYEDELDEFKVAPKPKAGVHDNTHFVDNRHNPMVAPFIQSSLFAITPYDIESDPWIESMAAFVANKRSIQTRRVYSLVLNQFFAFTAKHPSDIKQSDLIRYRHHLEHLQRTSSTIRLHLSAISGYYTFCISHNLTLRNPVRGVNQPATNSYIKATWLNKEQAKTLLSQPNRNTIKGKRDYAIILTFLLTGLRRKELANIMRGDIQEKDGKIYLSYDCKGGARIIRDIPDICWEAMEDYLDFSGREINDDSPIFSSVTNAGENLRRFYGRNSHNGCHPLTPEAIRQMIAYYSHCAFGDKIKVSPHTLRHTAGTLLRKSGRTLEEVQSFLKHRRIDTTRRYLHVVESTDSELGEYEIFILEL